MTDLFYRDSDDRGAVRDAVPLILLHGLFGSADNLGALVRGLSGDRRVIAADLRNHGRSPHVDAMGYGAMADDVIALMDRLGLDRVDLFGHSMGGKVAMQLALDHGDRVHRLIVGDIAPVAYPPHHTDILRGMEKVAAAAPDSRKGADDILKAYVETDAVRGFLLTNWRRAEDGLWGWRLNLPVLVRDYGAIAAGNDDGMPFAGPALFLRGGVSDYVGPEHRDRILALFPKASVRTIEQAGHWFHAEKPDMTIRQIVKFLDSP